MQGYDRSGPSMDSDTSSRASSGACCYKVRGLGENEPARVELPSAEDIATGIAICDEEIRLIAKAIADDRIPVPEAMPKQRPSFDLAIDRLEGIDATKIKAYPPGHVAPRSRSYMSRVSFLNRVTSYMKRERFAPIADKVADVARGETIVVIGDDARAAASLLCARGMEGIHLDPSPPTPVSRRTARQNSLLNWICCSGNDIAELGAVVLIGDQDFSADLAALSDSDAPPPIVTAKVDEAGTVHVTSATPAVAPADDGPWPKISVVTVSFNQADYLEASIKSVLDQDYPNLEYIIIDGGSTDGSVDIIERYRDRCAAVVVEPDRGQSDALNKGFRLATGEMMNWLCSDDLLEPNSLKNIGRAYRRYGADLIAGGCVRIGETRDTEHYRHHTVLPLGVTAKLLPLDMLRFMGSWQEGNYFFQPDVFFSRRSWLASGAYLKEHLFYAMDYDLWLRMALAGATVRHIPVTIGCSRIHDKQKTQDNRQYLHQLRQLMEEYKDLFAELRAASPKPSPIEPA